MSPEPSQPDQSNANTERLGQFAIAGETLRSFASDVGGNFVAEARMSMKELEHRAKMFDYRDTWLEWLFKGVDPELYERMKDATLFADFKRVAVDYEFRSFSIRFEIDETNYSSRENSFMLAVSAFVEQKHRFSIKISNKPQLDLGGDVIDRKPPSEFKKKLGSVGLLEWVEALPKREHRLAFKLPMLQDKFRAVATERLLGDLYVNDQRLRASLLNIKKLGWFSLCYPDILTGNTQALLYCGHVDSDDVRHLKDVLKVMQDALEVGLDLDVIAR